MKRASIVKFIHISTGRLIEVDSKLLDLRSVYQELVTDYRFVNPAESEFYRKRHRYHQKVRMMKHVKENTKRRNGR
jgi:hypothetical protein